MSRAKKSHLDISKTSIASRTTCDMVGRNEEGALWGNTPAEGVAEKAQTLERGGDFPLRTS